MPTLPPGQPLLVERHLDLSSETYTLNDAHAHGTVADEETGNPARSQVRRPRPPPRLPSAVSLTRAPRRSLSTPHHPSLARRRRNRLSDPWWWRGVCPPSERVWCSRTTEGTHKADGGRCIFVFIMGESSSSAHPQHKAGFSSTHGHSMSVEPDSHSSGIVNDHRIYVLLEVLSKY